MTCQLNEADWHIYGIVHVYIYEDTYGKPIIFIHSFIHLYLYFSTDIRQPAIVDAMLNLSKSKNPRIKNLAVVFLQVSH